MGGGWAGGEEGGEGSGGGGRSSSSAARGGGEPRPAEARAAGAGWPVPDHSAWPLSQGEDIKEIVAQQYL